MQLHIPKHFASAIGRNLDYWIAQIKQGSDADNKRLLPFHTDVVQAARFGISIPDTQTKTAILVEQYYNLIERHRLESVWLPLIEKLTQSAVLSTVPEKLNQLRFRQAALLRVSHQLEQATAILRQLHQSSLTSQLNGRVLLELSECARARNNHVSAATYAQKALAIFSSMQDAKWEASALNDLGIIATEQNQFAAAEAYLDRAFQFESQHNDPSRLITVLINQGRLHEFKQDPWRAIRCYFEAQEYFDEVADSADTILTLINLANVYNQVDEHKKARDSLRQAEQQLQAKPHLYQLRLLARLNLGVTAYKLEQFDHTIYYSREAATLAQQLNKHALEARALLNAGSGALKLDNRSQALHYFMMAQQPLEEAPATPWVTALKSELRKELAGLGINTDQISAETQSYPPHWPEPPDAPPQSPAGNET